MSAEPVGAAVANARFWTPGVMTASRVRLWFLVHKWTSLVCTAFLLILCVTGLPLVFREEIAHWLDDSLPYADLPPNAPRADLDLLVAKSRALYPGEVVTWVFVDNDEPQVMVSLAPSWAAVKADPESRHWIKFDSRSARILKQSDARAQRAGTFLGVMLSLHRDLFLGVPGELFLAAMALLFVTAIVSGVVLYGRFMRRVDFGTVRRDRSRRRRWLDLHNLLGVVTLAWALVVGLTGVINELTTPLFQLFLRTEVREMLAPWRGMPLPAQGEIVSAQAAYDTAKRALPDMKIISVVFPGSEYGSPHHYLLWAKGATPLTARLLDPVLVDARTGAVTAIVPMPWYLRALEVSRPLHFGDYGGLPLKIIWVLLDLVTIAVLVSGLYLCLSRRRSPIDAVIAELERGDPDTAPALAREPGE